MSSANEWSARGQDGLRLSLGFLQCNQTPSANSEVGKSKSAYIGKAALDYHAHLPVDGANIESMRAFTLVIWDSNESGRGSQRLYEREEEAWI